MTNTEPSRRAFLAGVAGLGLGSLLSACTGDEGFTPSQTGPTGPAKKYNGQLVIAIVSDPAQQARDALTAAYKKVQPDVTLVWETRDFGDGYSTWLGTQLAAGSIHPDIVSGNYVPSFRGYVNFDEYQQAVNPYTGNPWSKDVDFVQAREANALSQRIMLPTQSVHINWFYNKDLFARAGVTPPSTWDQFVDVSARLKANGVTPVAANFKWQVPQWFSEVYFDQYHVDWVETVRARQGDWNFDPKLDGAFTFDPADPNIHSKYTYSPQRFFKGLADGALRYDTPAVAEIVANMAKIFPRYGPGDFFVIEDPYPLFLQQHAAILASGAWDLANLTNDLKELSPERLKELSIPQGSVKSFQWGTFENPAMQGPLVKSKPRSVESSGGYYVSVVDKNARQRELALDFCMFWLSHPGQQPFIDGEVQSGTFTAAGPSRVSGVRYPPDYTQNLSMIKLLGNAEILYNQFWTVGNDAANGTDLHNLYQNAITGALTPQAYGAALQKYVTDNMDKILKAATLTRDDIANPARRPASL